MGWEVQLLGGFKAGQTTLPSECYEMALLQPEGGTRPRATSLSLDPSAVFIHLLDNRIKGMLVRSADETELCMAVVGERE